MALCLRLSLSCFMNTGTVILILYLILVYSFEIIYMSKKYIYPSSAMFQSRGIDGDTIMRSEMFYDEVTGTSPYYGPVVQKSAVSMLHDTKKRVSKLERSTSYQKSSKKLIRGSAVSPEPKASTGFKLSTTR